MKKTSKVIISLLLIISLISGLTGVSYATGALTTGNSSMMVGVGKADITGPITKISTGYNSLGDLISGLTTRLYARAFIAQEKGGKPVVYCSAELVHMTESIKPAVIKELNARGLTQYTEENVMLSATHCHSSTSNTSWYALYDLINGVPGYDDDSYKIIVQGIANAIEEADKDLAPGKIVLSYGQTDIESANRSISAAQWNVNYKDYGYSKLTDIEQALKNPNKEMQVLRFMHGNDDIGMLSFFASHGTSNGMDNRLLASDHKGYACLFVESAMGGNYVAANCQTASGDISPNLPDPKAEAITDAFLRPADRFKNLDVIENQVYAGQQEADAMLRLLKGGSGVTTIELSGPISVNYSTADFSNISVDEKYIGEYHMPYDDVANAKTTEPCIGAGLIAGDEEGAPVDNATEGTVRHNYYLDDNGNVQIEKVNFADTISLYGLENLMGPIWPTAMKLLQSDSYDDAQMEKVVCLAVGKLMQKNQPLQLIRIGQLAIAGVSFEITNEQGYRTVAQLEDTLSAIGVEKVILSTHSNAYSQYVTTREEFAAQHYEGATNLFGPWTGPAVTQELDRLAQDMVKGVASDKGPGLRNSAPLLLIPTYTSILSPSADKNNPGKLVTDTEKSYTNNNWVYATFESANPRHVAKLQLADPDALTDYTYMEVQKYVDGKWVTIKTDIDPYTTISFDTKANTATVGWLLRGVEDGTYRLVYNYITKTGDGSLLSGLISRLDTNTNSYVEGTVTSSPFTIGKATVPSDATTPDKNDSAVDSAVVDKTPGGNEGSIPGLDNDILDKLVGIIGDGNVNDVIDKIQSGNISDLIKDLGSDKVDQIKDLLGSDNISGIISGIQNGGNISDILDNIFGNINLPDINVPSNGGNTTKPDATDKDKDTTTKPSVKPDSSTSDIGSDIADQLEDKIVIDDNSPLAGLDETESDSLTIKDTTPLGSNDSALDSGDKELIANTSDNVAPATIAFLVSTVSAAGAILVATKKSK